MNLSTKEKLIIIVYWHCIPLKIDKPINYSELFYDLIITIYASIRNKILQSFRVRKS